MQRNLDVYFRQLDEYNGFMMSNTKPAYTHKQVMVQSLLLNNMVTGAQWYVDMVKNIAYWNGKLSQKQQDVIDRLIAKAINQPVANQQPAHQVQNPTALFCFLQAATNHLQRPHVWIPLDPNKPITQSCDVIKVTLNKQTKRLDLVVRVRGNENTYVGSVDTNGVATLLERKWLFKNNLVDVATILNTLNLLASDPVGNTSKWGKLLSRCCYCWLPLSTPESLAVGYGPDCAAHYHLPWGKGAGVLTQTQALANVAHTMQVSP